MLLLSLCKPARIIRAVTVQPEPAARSRRQAADTQSIIYRASVRAIIQIVCTSSYGLIGLVRRPGTHTLSASFSHQQSGQAGIWQLTVGGVRGP
jgi:hypothetical protein